MVSLGKFLPARELEPGHDFLLADGREAVLEAVEIEDAPEGELFTTYNFEVADYHTYFVGTEGVWVHNTGVDPCDLVRTLLGSKLKQGKRFREAFVESINEVKHTTDITGELKVPKMFQTGSDHVLKELLDGNLPGPNPVDHLPTIKDWNATTGLKNLNKYPVENGVKIDPAKGPIRGHHIATKDVQEKLDELLNRSLDYDESPVKVLLHEEHAGSAPTALHRKMEVWNGGSLTRTAVDEATDARLLMNDLIRFYAESGYPDCAAALKAWATKHNVPFGP